MSNYNASRNVLYDMDLLYPKEELAEIEKKRQEISIGIPNESSKLENRVALTPESVNVLSASGCNVVIEAGAGDKSSFSDLDYLNAGATISKSRREVYGADVVLQVSPFTSQEIDLLRGMQLVISSLLISGQTQENIKKMMSKKITALCFEHIKDVKNCNYIVRSMSEIAGSAVIMLGGKYLSKDEGGKGIIIGNVTGVSPSEVVILGAGTVAENAAKLALAMGSKVQVFDKSLYRLNRLTQIIGKQIYTSVFHPPTLTKALSSADLIIGALRRDDEDNNFVVSSEMTKNIKKGSVVIDLSIDQGGTFESSKLTNHKKPTFVKEGVLYYCVPNVPSIVPRTASIALSNVLLPLLNEFILMPNAKNFIKLNSGVRSGVYIYNGILTNSTLGHVVGIDYKDINLLLAAL